MEIEVSDQGADVSTQVKVSGHVSLRDRQPTRPGAAVVWTIDCAAGFSSNAPSETQRESGKRAHHMFASGNPVHNHASYNHAH